MSATEDERWFHLIHVEIESHAGAAVFALQEAGRAARLGDAARVGRELEKVPPAFERMIRAFRRITEKCRTEVYYHTLRPYLFGFDGVVYQGVDAFGEKLIAIRLLKNPLSGASHESLASVLVNILNSPHAKSRYRSEYNKSIGIPANGEAALILALYAAHLGKDAPISFLSNVFKVDIGSLVESLSSPPVRLELF
ncbi:MAG: hypothetical protein AAF360_19235, partial [Pseudomonadota bacterium]